MQNDNSGRLPSEALAFAQGNLHLQAVSEAANDAIQAARGIFAAYLEEAFERETDAAEQRALVRFQLKLMTAAFLVGEAFIALPPEDKGIMDRLFRSVLELEERLQTDRGESAAALDFARLGACICAARTARGWTLEEAAGVIAAPFWSTIEQMPEAQRERLAYLRETFASLLITGPFSILLGFTGGMMALNDRLKLRSMVCAEKGEAVYFASEECAIRVMEPDVETLWAPRGGQAVVVRLNDGVTV